VLVLTTAYSGARELRSLLGDMAGLACTSGTGVLPLCEQAAQTWRIAEAGSGPLSSLAIAAIRAMASSLITTILVRKGARRWCEISTAPPASAQAFLQAFPQTRVLCLHRSCPDVIYNAIHDTGWGLASPTIAPFAAAHPASSVASVGAYWAASTRELLAFEAAHPDVCQRVRFEDLAGRPEARDAVLAFLDAARESSPSLAEQALEQAASLGLPEGFRLPAEQFPAPLLDEIEELMARLGYPEIASAPC
jgi:hypothetical protein